MGWVEKTAPWVIAPVLLTYGLYVVLLFMNSIAAYILEKKPAIEKIMNFLSGGGAIFFVIAFVYVIIISAILIFNKIFL